LYVAIDFTPDNTFDGDADYTKVYVKTNSGVKEFKVSVPETTWGQQFFTYTDKVSYQHKVYEYQIPLASLDIAAGQTELQLGFAAYGTAASGEATDNDQTHVGIDGRDISVTWKFWHRSIDSDKDRYTYDIYMLPSILARTPDLASDKPINKSPIPYGINKDEAEGWNWTGSSTDTLDSTKMPMAGGEYKIFIYTNFNSSPADGVWVYNSTPDDPVSYSITLQSDVDASKFAVVDNYTGTQDKLQSAANAVGANLPVTAYLWTDSNSNGAVNPGELGSPISLGTSAADGSVAAANIGDLSAATYKFVITATDNGIESTKDAAHAVTVTLTNGALPLDVTLDSISSSNPTAGVAKVGDTVTVTFTSNRELSALPNVYIGGFGTAIPATSVSGNVYSAARTFTASDSEGDVLIYFSAKAPGVTDKTVNTTKDSGGNSVNFDKTAPAGTLSINGGAAATDSVSVTLVVTGKDPDGVAVYTKAEKQPILLASTNHLILRELAASMKLAAALPPSVPGTGNVQMSFSNDEVFWSAWEPVAGTKPWTLSAGNGTKTVYMKLKDAAGNEMATVITASIELQEATPLAVTLNSISSSNPTAGVAKVGDTVTVTFTSNRELSALPDVYIGDFGTAIPATSVSGNVYSAARTFTVSDSEGDVRIYFNASAPGGTSKTVNTTTDSSGNSVNFDKTSPTGTLSINGGAAATNSVSVTLAVTGKDPDGIGAAMLTKAEKQPILLASTNHLILRELAASMKLAAALPPSVPGTGNVQMSFSNDEVSWSAWEPVAETKPWTLSAGNGTKTVYMKLKDAAGNETATAITSTIELRVQESFQEPPSSGGGDSYQQSEPIPVNEPSKVIVEIEDVKPEAEKQHKAYISGYPDGTFGPEKSITRAEMATVLFRVFEKAANRAHFTYTDVASTHWAQEAIEQVTKMSLMEGYADGSFKAEQMITRAEIAVILSRLSSNTPSSGESFPDVKGHWAQSAIEQLKATGIISGYADGMFRPEQTLKRAEVVAMINKLLGRGPLTTMAARWSDVPNDHWAFGQIQEASIDHASEQKANDN
jgi:hypothetical protein